MQIILYIPADGGILFSMTELTFCHRAGVLQHRQPQQYLASLYHKAAWEATYRARCIRSPERLAQQHLGCSPIAQDDLHGIVKRLAHLLVAISTRTNTNVLTCFLIVFKCLSYCLES